MRNIRPEPWIALAALLIAVALPALFIKMRGDSKPSYQDVEVYSHGSGENLTMSLEEYTARLIGGYTEYSLSDETLRALACALRTSALLCGESRCGHIRCDDGSHGLLYSETCGEREAQAVRDTAGLVITCGGALVPAAVHISSYLVTESAFNLSGTDISCLVSVSSPEIIVPETVIIEGDKMEMTVGVNYGVDFVSRRDSLTTLTDNAGRVEQVRFAGYTADGRSFSRALGLASDCWTVEYTGGRFVINVYGEGDGLGMSVMGAEHLSERGAGYPDILSHYYTGCEIVRVNDLLK